MKAVENRSFKLSQVDAQTKCETLQEVTLTKSDNKNAGRVHSGSNGNRRVAGSLKVQSLDLDRENSHPNGRDKSADKQLILM